MEKSNNRLDNYYTPEYLAKWAVNYALDIVGGDRLNLCMLEPGCGEYYPFTKESAAFGVESIGIDNRISFDNDCTLDIEELARIELASKIHLIGKSSFLEFEGYNQSQSKKFDMIITNPPFSLAEEFVWRGLDLLNPSGVMIFLLKLPFLASKRRINLFETRPPKEVFVIQRRPSFIIEGGKTDMTEYGFYVWLGERSDDYFKKYGGRQTILKWLDNTKLEGYSVGQRTSGSDKNSEEIDCRYICT